MTEGFWKRKSLKQMSSEEWESLCDGCALCCLQKLEDEDTGEVALTRVACRLFDDETCRCGQYDIRHQFVPECIVLRPDNMHKHAYWMPQTCAYRLLAQGEDLPWWHPLVSGRPETVEISGNSARGRVVSETEGGRWEHHLADWPQ